MAAQVEDVTEAMKDVVDPELGINVVDLGLIYDAMVDENNIAVLNMTLTPDTVLEPNRGNASVVVYAVNYNVLRIVNGFGGVLFTI